ncbi:uncharacterized protein LOC124717332 [Schistocerca piceifrons]|uniref:uncharacterized protein LOC124717332 n=1 Tax=Schistocerca piceifrons TaxID=274613 RepID=UPI001F5E797B|nr:uncharacterized protein LOC124717332 [Schistocerca piceifrons]
MNELIDTCCTMTAHSLLCLQMFLRHVCLVLSVACLALADDKFGHHHPHGGIVQCLPNMCDEPCPTLPSYCPSGVIKNCGCCDVCWIYLKEGEICRKFIPENTMCSPGLECGSQGVCVPMAEQNVEDAEDSSDCTDSSE